MKKIGIALGACAALAVACGPSSQDAKDAMMTLSAAESVDAADVWRILYQGCSEIKRCADGCAKELSMCADGKTDEAQCATLQAYCSRDARKSAEKGVAGKAWFAVHLTQFLDDVRPKVAEADRARFDAARAKLKLTSAKP